MESSLYLFENMGQIPDRFILEADAALGLTRRKQRKTGKRKLLRTLLIAAAITALLGATAYAMGLLGLSERIFPVEGTEKVVVVPNGLKGTKTYEGTGEWWIWQDEHRNEAGERDLRQPGAPDGLNRHSALPDGRGSHVYRRLRVSRRFL